MTPRARILLLEDEISMRRTLSRVLNGLGYECEGVGTVREARESLREAEFDLVICDLMLPGENGLKLVEELEHSDSEIAVLVATAIDDPRIAEVATGYGVDGYLVKPFTNNELQINVECALGQSRRRIKLRERSEARGHGSVPDAAEETRTALIDAATAENDSIDRERAMMLGRLSWAVGERDLETGDHIRRMGEHSSKLARAFEIGEESARRIGLAAPMHDVGKVAVPDAILLKPGPLTPEERRVMERHTEIGHNILAGTGSTLLDLAATIALTHHERFDGGGYPRGLSGDSIPLPGRIVAVADLFDALVSHRPYRDAMSVDEAVEIMRGGRGSHLDPDLLDCFVDNLGSFELPDNGY